MNNKISIKSGTISFWIKANKIEWGDSRETILFNINTNDGGNLFLVKDNDNRLKFFHIYLGKGKTNLEIDVKKLSTVENHHIVITWDTINSKQIGIYIDAGENGQKIVNLNYRT